MTGDDWRNILGNMMHGIYLLTTSGEEEINGMIVSWVSPVSWDGLGSAGVPPARLLDPPQSFVLAACDSELLVRDEHLLD